MWRRAFSLPACDRAADFSAASSSGSRFWDAMNSMLRTVLAVTDGPFVAAALPAVEPGAPLPPVSPSAGGGGGTKSPVPQPDHTIPIINPIVTIRIRTMIDRNRWLIRTLPLGGERREDRDGMMPRSWGVQVSPARARSHFRSIDDTRRRPLGPSPYF